ncbi:MAG: phosphoribosylformylglycinamidine cyclo-ligase [Candidatus Eisenbacteria bacterium]|nr:phosphoribosylformylglycinamidine cyclo-ligase [Candidatus Eisenbacteria bacterium]
MIERKDKRTDTYKASGVDIDAGQEAVRLMRGSIQSTWDDGIRGRFGAFAGLYDASSRMESGDVLGMTIDGVGTKLKVAVMCGRYDSVGKDIVNHCTDDLLVQRVRPMLFADYFASSVLSPEVVAEAVAGMAEACRVLGCNLIAGETAEMPGVYSEGEIDLVGCMLGVARRSDIEDVHPVSTGDVLLGLPSTGLHTNGYSLARHLLFERAGYSVDTHLDDLGCTVGEELLKVHKEYFTLLEPHLGEKRIHALAHITGGGLIDNMARVLPETCDAVIDKSSWETPAVFSLLQSLGSLPDHEAYRALNMGIGMVIVADAGIESELTADLRSRGAEPITIGAVRDGDGKVVVG